MATTAKEMAVGSAVCLCCDEARLLLRALLKHPELSGCVQPAESIALDMRETQCCAVAKGSALGFLEVQI